MEAEEFHGEADDAVSGQVEKEDIPIPVHPLPHEKQEAEGGQVQDQFVELGGMDGHRCPGEGYGPGEPRGLAPAAAGKETPYPAYGHGERNDKAHCIAHHPHWQLHPPDDKHTAGNGEEEPTVKNKAPPVEVKEADPMIWKSTPISDDKEDAGPHDPGDGGHCPDQVHGGAIEAAPVELVAGNEYPGQNGQEKHYTVGMDGITTYVKKDGTHSITTYSKYESDISHMHLLMPLSYHLEGRQTRPSPFLILFP